MKASVIIRAFNSEPTVGRALASALSQEPPEGGFETLVVNDGSTDGTRRVLAEYAGAPGVRILEQENRGAVAAANAGFTASRGEFAVLLDADDEFRPGLLRSLAGLLDGDRGADLAYPDYEEESEGVSRRVSPANLFETVAVGTLFRRESLLAEGLFREGTMFPEYDLYLRTLGRWKALHRPEALFVYHRGPRSLTADAAAVQRELAALLARHPDKASAITLIRSYGSTAPGARARAGSAPGMALRPARASDLPFFFLLVNEPTVRESAFRRDPVPMPTHRKWFSEKLSSAGSHLFVLEVDGAPAGEVRLDIRDDSAETDVAILPSFRGRGCAVYALREACRRVFALHPGIETIRAHIRSENVASQRSFAKAGFVLRGPVVYNGHRSVEMLLDRGDAMKGI